MIDEKKSRRTGIHFDDPVTIVPLSGEDERLTPITMSDGLQTSQRAVSLAGWGGAIVAGLLLWVLLFVWLL